VSALAGGTNVDHFIAFPKRGGKHHLHHLFRMEDLIKFISGEKAQLYAGFFQGYILFKPF